MKIPNIKFNPYLSALLLLGVILLAQAVYTPLSNIVKAGLGPASVDIDYIVDPDEAYQTSGLLTSVNLLSGQATALMNGFSYSASMPENTSLKVQFSRDGDNWYSATGVLDGMTAMSDGSNNIDLSGLGWWGNIFYYKMIFGSDGLATPVLTSVSLDYTADYVPSYTVYHASGTMASVNLLPAEVSAINGFIYNASSIPTSTSIAVSFSQDNTNWYSASGTPNGWDMLTPGTSTINLSALGWWGSSFFYKAIFNSNYAQTPILNSVAVGYAGSDSYWVGGSGNWSDATNHWAAESGGAPDASNLPGPGSTIHFDANSCSSTCAISINSAIRVKNFNLNNANATVTQTASTTISGDLNVTAGTLAVGTNNLTVTGNSTINGTLTIGASAGTGWTTNNLTIGAGGTASSTASGGTPYYNQVTTSWKGSPGSPDPTGIFTVKGFYNGKPYYKNESNGWFIWWNGNSWWVLSDALGSTINPSWVYAVSNFPPAGWNTYRGSSGSPITTASTTSGTFIGGNYSKITISGNFDQSNTASKFLAASSLITVNGNGTFTADGTVNSAQYNSASLVLNGNNTLTYNNLVSYSSDGFNNLITGQNGNITINSGDKSILNTLVVGSGTFTGTNNIVLLGSTPLFFDTDSHLSGIGVLFFYGTSQTIPSLNNGYDVNILLRRTGTTVNQTGNVVLNSDKYLRMGWSSSYAPSINTWNTNGYDLNVGGNLEIGGGSDTGLKTLDATNYTNPDPNATSIITVGGNWLNYGNFSAPSQFVHGSSTVIFNKSSGTQTITSGANNSPFYNLTHSGAGTLQLIDPLVATGNVLLSTGTFNPNGQNITTAGNFTIADGSAVTASGLNSATYYNQVTVSGAISPDATGVYTMVGMYNGKPYYRRGSDNWYVRLSTFAHEWLLIQTPPLSSGGPYWTNGGSPATPIGNYSYPLSGASGIATVSNVTASGLIGTTWTVGGNFSAFGHEGALLTLNPASTWYLNVAGTGSVDYVNVANSNASGGIRINQTNSIDGGNNLNWGFDFEGPTIATTTLSGFTVFGNYIKGAGTIVGGLATDISGVDGDTCEYTLNGGISWLAGVWDANYCKKTGISINDGEYYTFNTRAKDIIGNQGTGTPTITYTGDTTAPATTDDSDDNWHSSDQLIALTASDGFGSGVSSTYYCIDSEGVCEPEMLAIPSVAVTCAVGNICENYVRYYSVDNLGNAESVKTSNLVRIDKSLPTISNLNPASGAVVARTGQNVTFTTSKPADCRFASAPKAYAEMTGDYSCSVANSIQMSCVLPTLSYGVNDFYFACRDFLGNADSAESATKASYNLPAPVSSGGTSGYVFNFSRLPALNLPPSGPFSVIVNDGAKTTKSQKVELQISAGPDTTAVLVATNPDFSGAIVVPYIAGQTSLSYDLCQGSGTCLNKTYTIYTKFLTASGVDSPALATKISLQLPNLASDSKIPVSGLGEQVAKLIDLFKSKDDLALNFPPLDLAVPAETPLAFIKIGDLTLRPLQNFVLAPLPREFLAIANKFPQVAETLHQVGITNLTDAGKLEVARISLPGLGETLNLPSGQTLAVTDLNQEQQGQVPSNIVFARGGDSNLDLNIKLSISNQGQAIQSLNTIQGQPLALVVKPDKPARSVQGYLIFKSNRVGFEVEEEPQQILTKRGLGLISGWFIRQVYATEMKVEAGLKKQELLDERDNSKTGEPDLVLMKFDYQDAGNGIWTADVATPLVLGQYELRTVVNYENKKEQPEVVSMIVIVDPEGYVYRKLPDGSEARILGAVVSIYWLNPATDKFELWPARNFRQDNPQTTDVTGRYAFLVPPGDYYLKAVASGYGDYQSEVFKVEENKGVFMNLELKTKVFWWSWFNLQNILLAGILIALLYLVKVYKSAIIKRNNLIK